MRCTILFLYLSQNIFLEYLAPHEHRLDKREVNIEH